MAHNLFALVGLVAISFFCNLPLGRWRASLKKFSASWFLAVHLSIPLVLLLRLKMGLSVWAIPFTMGAAIAGQVMGGHSRCDTDKTDD